MVEVLIGIISGTISGTGMGGGTILIFLLTVLCGLEQHIAQATNLIFFIPTSIVAIIVNINNNFYIWNTWSNNRCKFISPYRCKNVKKIFWYIFSNYSIT